MNSEVEPLSKSYIVYQVFKYLVYAVLCYNLYIFYVDDFSASAQTFSEGVSLGNVVLAFSATIDTAAWILLLVVFELETFIVSDENIKGIVKWLMFAAKAICYFFIIYACYGYIDKLIVLSDYSVFKPTDVCNLIGSNFTSILTLDDYAPITKDVCQSLSNSSLIQINGTNIIGTPDALQEIQNLAWVDVINSIDWLLIVIILEIDVYLQLKGELTGRARRLSKFIKSALYSVLFINAIYWGFNGEAVDFWDAFLWIVAFFFIEMNIFEWHADTQENQAPESL